MTLLPCQQKLCDDQIYFMLHTHRTAFSNHMMSQILLDPHTSSLSHKLITLSGLAIFITLE